MTQLTDTDRDLILAWRHHVNEKVHDALDRADGRLTKQERKWWLEFGEYWRAVELAIYGLNSTHIQTREEIVSRCARVRSTMQKNIIDDLDIAKTTDEKEVLQARLDAVNEAFNAHLAITGIG